MSQVAGSLVCPLDRLLHDDAEPPAPGSAAPPLCDFAEARAWRALGGGWQCLYGCFCQAGVSIEWHDFTTNTPQNWALTFHPNSLELCLNLAGQARLQSGSQTVLLAARTAAFYRPDPDSLSAWRLPGSRHQFLTVEFSIPFLERHLQDQVATLDPVVRYAIRPRSPVAQLSPALPLTPAMRKFADELRDPRLSGPALGLWYQAKALELAAHFFFPMPADASVRHPRQQVVARDRVAKVIAELGRDLVAPPTLEALGRLVGCSPFHLSRTFSQETGMTIPQYLRQLRIEKAAELLKSGRFNVTEAAMEVGYSSVSHFSNAFRETLGCCPGLYPLGLASPVRSNANPRQPEPTGAS
jgi:AraC family transcriptional regulator